jgi:hypothetical protein
VLFMINNPFKEHSRWFRPLHNRYNRTALVYVGEWPLHI